MRGRLGDGSQSFPKARTPAASQKPYYSLHLLKTVLLSVMPSCQGLSVPLNESASNSSHRTRPGPFSSSVYPQKSKGRHPSARHSGYLLTKYLLLGSMDGEVGPQQNDRERERLGSAGSRALPRPPAPSRVQTTLGLQPASRVWVGTDLPVRKLVLCRLGREARHRPPLNLTNVTTARLVGAPSPAQPSHPTHYRTAPQLLRAPHL